jgi:hypothetical protein
VAAKYEIYGSYASGITINGAAYGSPFTVESTATISHPTYGVYAASSASLINHGSINAVVGVELKGGGSVSNDGSISASGGSGVFFGLGGTLTNAASGSIFGRSWGVRIDNGAGTVSNSGTIQSNSYGVLVNNGGSVTNEASGTIDSNSFGVFGNGTNFTVENAGTIIGSSYSVELKANGANKMIVDADAAFTGKVLAKPLAANTLELTAGGDGTLDGLGAKYEGFQTVTIDSGASWKIAGTLAGFDASVVPALDGTGSDRTIASTIQGFHAGDQLDITDLVYAAGDTATYSSGHLTIYNAGHTSIASVGMTGNFGGHFFNMLSDGSGGSLIEEDGVACYCRGTKILTERGEVAVEHLRTGDLVVTLGGEALPLKWIGRRSYREWLAVGNDEVQPILFKAGAIADGVPARDLYVSPDHAMYLDGVLVPARHLANGTSIVKMSGVEEIDYFHLEFARHVVILAEGAAAESFVDDDSRMMFHNAEEYRRLYPDEPRCGQAEFCAPRVDWGPAVEALRRALVARASHLRPDPTRSIATHALAAGLTDSVLDAVA